MALNGRLATSELASIGRGFLLRADAARQFLLLNAAFQAVFGYSLLSLILETYRTYARQVTLRQAYENYLFRKGPFANLAAVAGTSLHGWGLSIDFAWPLNDDRRAEHKWLRENGPKFGWYWTGRDFSPQEDWHFDFKPGTASITTTAGVSELVPLVNRSKAEILDAQQHLVRLGYNIKPDSEYGPATKAAVTAYQKSKGLTPDGDPGPRTMAALRKDVADLLARQAAERAEAARLAELARLEKLARETTTMFDLYWSTTGTGYLGTPFGSTGLPSMQVFKLFERRIQASRNNKYDQFNQAEVDIMESFLVLIMNARLAGVKLDVNKLAKAINAELSIDGLPVQIKDVEWDISVDAKVAEKVSGAVATALDAALPKISASLLRQQAEALQAAAAKVAAPASNPAAGNITIK